MQTIMREFNTRNFRVVASIEPDCDVDTSFDETGETSGKLASGEWEAFQTSVVVYWNGAEIGADHLGGSIYANPSDFFKEHIGLAAKRRADGCNYGSYFSDMIHEAIKEARKHMADVPKLRNPKGWEEVDGVKLPPITWADREPRTAAGSLD